MPNVQTVDDLLMEHVLPGDVILFDRRCQHCQTAPAALACLTNRHFLTSADDENFFDVIKGKFDHVGVVVPHPASDAIDAEKYILEFTAGDGVVARPLLSRLEMSRSRSILLLPVCLPGEQRDPNGSDYIESEKSKAMRAKLTQKMNQFRDVAIRTSQQNGFGKLHSTLSMAGSIAYAMNIHEKFPFLPVNPSSWLVVSALQEAGAAAAVEERAALNAKPGDFLRDHRFHEGDCVRLRPGWRFMRPVAVRENAR